MKTDYVATVNKNNVNVSVGTDNLCTVNGEAGKCSVIKISDHNFILNYLGKLYDATLAEKNGETTKYLINGNYYNVEIKSKLRFDAEKILNNKSKTERINNLIAPMPGLILKIKKKAGEKVSAGESLVILEAMKMENNLVSPTSGHIKNINIKEGTSVEKNEVILTIG